MEEVSTGGKRKPKGPIKFQINLTEEQKQAKATIMSNTVTVLKGSAGSGKSMVAAQVALDMLFKRDIEKIVLTRPAVTSGEDLGFLPGDKDAKLAPYTAAIYDNMYRLYKKEIVDKHLQEGNIEVIPLAFMRGRNLSNCMVVVDEAQNITHRQMELMLGRLCHGSKMILCGDTAQIDLKDKKMSGFDFICKNFTQVQGFSVVTLKTNHRHEIVEDILKIYNDYRD
jgi:phosphate starvation-inducible PhoH-like protein